MAAPIDLRNDFDSVSLRRLAKRTRDATQSRRLLALAEVYDGGSRTDASRIGGVGLQPRRWVVERTIAWLNRCRRLAKDWENLTRNALAFIKLASIRLMRSTSSAARKPRAKPAPRPASSTVRV